MTISAPAINSRSSSTSPSDRKSAARDNLFRLVLRKYADSPSEANGGPQPRVSSPEPDRSTLMMCAPRSPSAILQWGPASTRERSTTLTPSSGSVFMMFL